MERLTSRQLRARAAESGYKLSGARFNDLRKWGLIPAPDVDGLWSGNTAEQVVRVGELGRTVRALPRRVIILRCQHGVPVPPDKVRDAMFNVIPTITSPVGKMKRAMKARKQLAGPDTEQLTVREYRKRERDAWAPPPPDEWRDVLTRAIPERMEARFGIWWIAAQWSTERVRNTTHDVADIPLEELVTLFAIQDIAMQLENVERE